MNTEQEILNQKQKEILSTLNGLSISEINNILEKVRRKVNQKAIWNSDKTTSISAQVNP